MCVCPCLALGPGPAARSYYGQQKAEQTVAREMERDDFKRKAREYRERQGEANMLESLYTVRGGRGVWVRPASGLTGARRGGRGAARCAAHAGAQALAVLCQRNFHTYVRHARLPVQSERQKVLSTIRSEEEERMALALARRQQDKERQDKEVQRLREESDELRE